MLRVELTLMLERRTGDSRKDEGLRPGGMVIHAEEREIGSLAGDMSLYLAPVLDPTAEETLWEKAASELANLTCSEDSLMEESGDDWLYW